ncbi:hypothetical protein SprV_0401724300 [Sparganum proliferum]
MDHLMALLQEMWCQVQVPQAFKDATIVHLYKRKGNRQLCDSHRGISPLNIARKIFVRILLQCPNNRPEQGRLQESLCGFHHHRGTTDMIFVTRQRQNMCLEMKTHLYSTFVDLTKVFDTVNTEDRGKSCRSLAAPSDSLRWTDGQLFTQRRMYFQSRVSAINVHELIFADDCALNATSDGDMQRSMDLIVAARDNYGLVINTEKMVRMHQLPPDAAKVTSQINVNGAQLQAVDNFTYLGNALSRSTKIDNEVDGSISKASQAFDLLQNTVWNRRVLYPDKMYRAVILPTMLYETETRAVYKKQARRLNYFHLSCLRRIL